MSKQVWVVKHVFKFTDKSEYNCFTESVCATKELAIKDMKLIKKRQSDPGGDDWVYEEHNSHGDVFGWQNKKSSFAYEGVFAELIDFIEE